MITGNSALVSAWGLWERARYRAEIEKTSVPPPLFVLGIWRSGTTHLHNLLAQDDRFAYCTTYQALYPHTFLSTEHWHAPTLDRVLPATRPMDNMKYGISEPHEDEFALSASGLSFQLSLMAFPRTGAYFRRFLSLRDATPSELAAWKAAYITFLRKLTLKHGRPLVLKSPGHTARIKVLLELFPEAKFVHLHRHPHEVFQSTVHLLQKTQHLSALQRGNPDVDRVIHDYTEVYDAFFQQRQLIPAGNFCEVAFEDLERDPLGLLRQIYEKLRLPEFAHVEPRLRQYVQSLTGYQRNRFPELSADLQARLANDWQRSFQEWGYDQQPHRRAKYP